MNQSRQHSSQVGRIARALPLVLLIVMIALGVSGCVPTSLPTATPTRSETPRPTAQDASTATRVPVTPTPLAPTTTRVPPTPAPTLTVAPTATTPPSPIPTATRVPIPPVTLTRGELYFRVGGVPRFIFLRNMGGWLPSQYDRFLDAMPHEADQWVRISLDALGMGYTPQGALDETWAGNWEHILDHAAEHDIQVIPIFSAWYDWNSSPGSGFSMWNTNPFNTANGGPARTATELFQPDSPTNKLWLKWMETVVKRWQGRSNIAAWEIFSEVNLATGTNEAVSVAWVNQAASRIRAADSRHRPITASLAGVDEWHTFYQSDAIDFLNFHPYMPSGQLDTDIFQFGRRFIAQYGKPVLIGESGLSAATPDFGTSTLTTAPNARRGLEHAIWAGLVSGTLNGRAFWWEDGLAVHFQHLDWPFIQKNMNLDEPAARFARYVDFTGMRPLEAQLSAGIKGAALGNDRTVIGWVRDAGCEPPAWPLQPVVSQQTVTLTAPGASSSWRLDFYDVNIGAWYDRPTGVIHEGDRLILRLPDFVDAIAFKLSSQSN